MASRSRRDKMGPKLEPIVLPGKWTPEKFRYCIDHGTKMKPVLLWDSKVIAYECAEGCKLSKNQAVLK